MQFIIKTAILLSLIAFTGGCQSLGPNATTGGLIGTTGGGLIGASIGAHEGKSAEGALIGALAGGLTGSALGNQLDHADRIQRQQVIEQQQLARQQAITMDQIVQMTRSGLADDLIINQIYQSGVVAVPTPNDLILLKSNGVSDSVIQSLQSAGSGGRFADSMATRPVQVPVMVAEPFYCPPHYRAPMRFHAVAPYDCHGGFHIGFHH